VFLIVLVAAMGIANVLVLAVAEKTGEIAVLRTLGASARQVMAVFTLEGALLGGLGTLLGAGSGIGVAAYFRWQPYPLPGDLYFITQLPVEVQAFDVAWVCAVSLVTSVLASLLPARRAAGCAPPRSCAERGAPPTAPLAPERAWDYALWLLGRQAYTASEVARAAARRGWTPRCAPRRVARLQELRLLDDRAYAEAYVRRRRDERGRLALRTELRRKGVAEALVEGVLAGDDDDPGLDDDQQLRAAAALLAKHAWRFEGRPGAAASGAGDAPAGRPRPPRRGPRPPAPPRPRRVLPRPPRLHPGRRRLGPGARLRRRRRLSLRGLRPRAVPGSRARSLDPPERGALRCSVASGRSAAW
jgi:SOS response regulatory protein OraA/RecX